MDVGRISVQHGYLDQDFPSHGHMVWELHLFTSGQGALVQDGRRWPVGPGTLTLSPPRHLHQISVVAPLSFYYIQIDDPGASVVLRRLADLQRERGPFVVESLWAAEAARLKQRLDSPVEDRRIAGGHGVRAWLYDLAAGNEEPSTGGVDAALAWVGQNLHRRVSLDELARVAGLDRFGFCRRFKAKTGLSPLAYVHRSKVEAAGFLLADTDLPLAEVAQRLGFCDEFHFGKVFRRWRGVSPGRWRRDSPSKSSHNIL